MRMEVDDGNQFNGSMMEIQEKWPIEGYHQGGYSTRFLPQERIIEYPRTIESYAGLDHTTENVVFDRPISTSSFPQGIRYYKLADVVPDLPYSEPNFPQRSNSFNDNRSFRNYCAEEVVVPNQPSPRLDFTQERRKRADSPSCRIYHLSEEVVRGQPCSPPIFPQRSRYRVTEVVVPDQPSPRLNFTRERRKRADSPSCSRYYSAPIFPKRRRKIRDSPSTPSYSSFWPDSRLHKRNSYYDEARHTGYFKGKHQNRAKHSKRSPYMQTRSTPKRTFKKPMEKSVKSTSRSKLEKSVKSTSQPKETKRSRKDGEVGSSNPHVLKSSKDDEESNFSKKQAIKEDNVEATKLSNKLDDKPAKVDAGTNFPKELVTKNPENNVESNFTKNQETIKSTKLDEQANIAKEADVAKKLDTIVSVEDAEAELVKTLVALVSAENGGMDIVQKKEVKSLESDQKGGQCLKLNDDIPNVSSSDHNDSGMRNSFAKCPSKEGDGVCYVRLMKDGKIISRTKCLNPPIQLSSYWNVDIVKSSSLKGVSHLPQFVLLPAFESSGQEIEWSKFLRFLHENDKVGVVKFEHLKIHILPSNPTIIDSGLFFKHAVVAYHLQELCDTSLGQRCSISAKHGPLVTTVSSPPNARSVLLNEVKESPKLHLNPQGADIQHDSGFESDTYVKRSSSVEKGTCSSVFKCHEADPFLAKKEDVLGKRNFVCADPSYLKTLGHAHSSWIFGAIAELVDNSRDARASRLDIAIETIYDKRSGIEIPMLSIVDDGVGMDHKEILRMISFGHKQPDKDNRDRIGRFGVGFKTGAMRLGKDALVLTQTTKSCSVAFLSQSLNEGTDNLEIPVVSYRRQARFMEIDTDVQSEESAKYSLNAMKEFSPFNEYLIGEKAGLFRGKTGTQIYIWNLDKWGSEYTLEWQEGLRGGSSFHQGDIFIRSRRVRTRPGQTSRKVHLDYSLRSYLEVIFLEPRMKIYVQNSLVRSHPLAKSLNNTTVINDEVRGKQVQLTLGRCQLEWDEGNCGIFLYWHGRLIEAYKRVGGMIHSADMGRGVIGVTDVTQLMEDGNGGVWVHSNKQGFQDCEAYAYLEEWLGHKADEYWDKHFDPVQFRKGNARYKPDNEWVQCEKCRKWRMLNPGFDSRFLPKEWFCYMEPFNGRCEMAEEKLGRGVITVGLRRSYHDISTNPDCEEVYNAYNYSPPARGKSDDELPEASEEEVQMQRHALKRLRRGPARSARKPLPLEVL